MIWFGKTGRWKRKLAKFMIVLSRVVQLTGSATFPSETAIRANDN